MNIQYDKISRVGSELACQASNCKERALSFSQFCWEHTPNKPTYIKNLKEALISDKYGDGFILKKVVLQNAELPKLRLNNCDLSQADLKGSNLFHSDIKNTNLMGSNLENCDLSGVNFEKSDLIKANIRSARLWHANMSQANLSEASLKEADLWKCNMYLAKLWRTELDNARSITMENFRDMTKQFRAKEMIDEKGILAAEESYRALKRHFMDNGRYKDASWASFKEKNMEASWLKENKDIAYIPLALMGSLCGYGEKPFRVIISSAGIILFYGIIYYFLKTIMPSFASTVKLTLLDHIYYSTITFTTVGYGDLIPKENIYFRLLSGSEAFIGAFMIGLFVFTLSRKYSAR